MPVGGGVTSDPGSPETLLIAHLPEPSANYPTYLADLVRRSVSEPPDPSRLKSGVSVLSALPTDPFPHRPILYSSRRSWTALLTLEAFGGGMDLDHLVPLLTGTGAALVRSIGHANGGFCRQTCCSYLVGRNGPPRTVVRWLIATGALVRLLGLQPITSIRRSTVTLDTDHPLAGKQALS